MEWIRRLTRSVDDNLPAITGFRIALFGWLLVLAVELVLGARYHWHNFLIVITLWAMVFWPLVVYGWSRKFLAPKYERRRQALLAWVAADEDLDRLPADQADIVRDILHKAQNSEESDPS